MIATDRPRETHSRKPAGRRPPTRQRIIDALVELLDGKPIWEISVTMLTKRVGVSSQLFYQHFACLEDVLVAHSDTILATFPHANDLLDGEWADEECYARMCAITERVLVFWDNHRPAMRVLNMLDDVQNPRFSRFRELRGRDIAAAFARLARRRVERGFLPAGLCCDLTGWTCASRLQGTGLSFPDLIAHGYSPETIRQSTSALLAISLGFQIPTEAM